MHGSDNKTITFSKTGDTFPCEMRGDQIMLAAKA